MFSPIAQSIEINFLRIKMCRFPLCCTTISNKIVRRIFWQSFRVVAWMEYGPISRAEKIFHSSGYLTLQRATIIWDGPRYPFYNTTTERFRTYTDWPHGLNPSHESLSAAGFYCTGRIETFFQNHYRCYNITFTLIKKTLFTVPGDITKRCHCWGGLQNWRHTDDAWT